MITSRMKRTRTIATEDPPPTGPQPAVYAIMTHLPLMMNACEWSEGEVLLQAELHYAENRLNNDNQENEKHQDDANC
jgi:hypothetical protein